MDNKNYNLHLSLNPDASDIILIISTLGLESMTSHYPYKKLKESNSGGLFMLWLIHALHPVLYDDCFESINITYSTSSTQIHREYGTIIERISFLIQNTQKFIAQHKAIFLEKLDSFDQTLFCNVDNFPLFEENFNAYLNTHPDKTHYLNIGSGWNKERRTWDTHIADSLSLEQFIEYILKNKIKKIFSVNMYFLSQLMEKHSFLPLPFFKSLNIEWITIDYDLYEQKDGFFLAQRDAFSCSDFRRFSLWPHAFTLLDQSSKNKNVHYFSPNKRDPNHSNLSSLNEKFEIIIASHTRMPSVLAQLPEILFFLEHTTTHDTYLDFQKLYYALVHLIMTDKNSLHIEKLAHFSYITNIHSHALSLLKYDVIQVLANNRIPTKIYGDHYWEILFPESYQKNYLSEDELCTLLKSKKYLYLLMNQNYSYFENNFVISRAIQQNAPYLCFPSLTITPDLSGLKLLEYADKTELISKISTINTLITSPEYNQSLQIFRNKNHMCDNEFIKMIAESTTENHAIFKKIYQEHSSFFLKTLGSYFNEHHERIFKLYDGIFSHEAQKFNILNSRYHHEPFFEKLIQHHKRLCA